MKSSLETEFQWLLNNKKTLSEKESHAKLLSARVQERVDALTKAGESPELLARFAEAIKHIMTPFPLPSLSEVASLNRDLKAGKLTLQARAKGPTPLFHTESIYELFGGATGTELILNDFNQIDPVETVVLPGGTFQIVGALLDHENVIYQVTTPEYPYETDKGHFLDARFVDALWMPLSTLPVREKHMPEREVILENLRSSLGLRYIWGGVVPTGVPKLLEYYAPRGCVNENLRDKWMLAGVDCSGLLYAATEGSTPRNTSAIIEFGKGIDIGGKTSAEIIALLQPLDVIAWKGHMLIVLNQKEVIQSRANYGSGAIGFQNGVRVSPLRETLDEFLIERTPVNSIHDPVPDGQQKIVVRRWYEH